MSKLLIFNFDGTSNDPQDAEQEIDPRGNIEDDSMTNIAKLHAMFGGDFKDNSSPDYTPAMYRDQLCFYYSGVGTYGNAFQRAYNAVFAQDKHDVARILWLAKRHFAKNYAPGDKILVTGFSRGAALARRFASLIHRDVENTEVIEIVFDTVASIGLPNMKKSDRPESEVVFEHGHTLPANVYKALHCVSLDDKRKVFQPTLMNTEPRIQEIWFAGAHSDVGGGYYYDGLSDNVLRFVLSWIDDLNRDTEWRISVIPPSGIDYGQLTEKRSSYQVTLDDIAIDPNIFGKSHQQKRIPLVSLATLTDRLCCVIEADEITNIHPSVHHSVAERIARDSEYKPKSLKNIVHEIVYDNGSTKRFRGIVGHKEGRLNHINIPETGEEHRVAALAHNKFNHTGLYLVKGNKYAISVQKRDGKEQTWFDAKIECDANGWNRDDVKLGLSEVAIAGSEYFRRVPDADWFCLCGTIGDNDDHAFKIGKAKTVTAKASGELCLFANDLDRFYGNNFGKLEVTVKRIA